MQPSICSSISQIHHQNFGKEDAPNTMMLFKAILWRCLFPLTVPIHLNVLYAFFDIQCNPLESDFSLRVLHWYRATQLPYILVFFIELMSKYKHITLILYSIRFLTGPQYLCIHLAPSTPSFWFGNFCLYDINPMQCISLQCLLCITSSIIIVFFSCRFLLLYTHCQVLLYSWFDDLEKLSVAHAGWVMLHSMLPSSVFPDHLCVQDIKGEHS